MLGNYIISSLGAPGLLHCFSPGHSCFKIFTYQSWADCLLPLGKVPHLMVVNQVNAKGSIQGR